MFYRILADANVIMHFMWILFMLLGFLFTLQAFFYKKSFFDWLKFRVIHLCGIFYVSLLAILGKYCPLTIWENIARSKYKTSLTYPGSFMIHYVEKLVYPDTNPLIIQIPITFIAIFTILVFIIRPPKGLKGRFEKFLRRILH